MPEISKEILVSEEDIAIRVGELAKEISDSQNGRPLTIIGILKGSFIFLADLVRKLTCPVTCEFIRVVMTQVDDSSPREIKYNVPFNISGKDVLIVEDIMDTGITLDYLIDHFKSQKPATIRICVLLDKETAHKVDINLDFVGFSIPNKYVIGYGLDFQEKHRDLPYITWVEGAEWELSK